MAYPSTLPLFNWPVERRTAMAALAITSLAVLTLLVVGILACAEVGSLRHLSSSNLKLIFSLALLLGIVDVVAIRKAYRYEQRQYMFKLVQEGWNRLERYSSFDGYLEHDIPGVTTIYLVQDLTPTFFLKRSCPRDMSRATRATRLPPEPPIHSPSGTPSRADVWPYLLWLKAEEVICCSQGCDPEGAERLRYLQAGTRGVADLLFLPGAQPVIVSLEELIRRSLTDCSGSIFEPLIEQLFPIVHRPTKFEAPPVRRP